MLSAPFKALWAVIVWLWRALDFTRRALLNLLVLLLLLALGWALLAGRGGGVAPLQDNTALVLALQGPIREQYAGNLRDSALQQFRGQDTSQLRLRDVLAALDAAKSDPAITRAVLVLDDFAGAGLPTLREVAAALQRFRAAGKQVVAWGSGYDQRQYFLAAHADEVYVHPMGSVQITGIGGQRSYYKDVLDTVGVTVHVLRAGEYKNAAETWVASGPSPETMEADRLLYDGLWALYTGAVEKARQLAPGSVQAALDALPERLAAAGGDAAKLALAEKWVDGLKTRDELRALLIERGVKDGATFRQIDLGSYLSRLPPQGSGDAVGVIVAEGAIVDGEAGGGTVGGLSTAELIRRAREEDRVKAIVLRVDSPGGSAFGSELVRRELELARQAGKPVVVSMGDVAASGGYWIATAADEVIADEATITGSIGVVAMLPSAERLLDRLGVKSGGYATSWLVDAYDPRRGLDPRMERVIQSSVDHAYAQFIGLAAQARKTTPDKIDAVARGRVWTGAQALERGLVDRTGSFEDALAAAANRGQLPQGHRVVYLDRGPSRLERLVELLGRQTRALWGEPAAGWLPAALAEDLQRDAAFLSTLMQGRQPFAAFTHCLCEAP